MVSGEDGRYKLDDFELYQIARAFRRSLSRLIEQLPASERNCLGPQMRRAAISITNNIAEGHGRWHYQENIQFCRIARGSIEEVLDDLNICKDERYGDQQLADELKASGYDVIRRVKGYISYLRKCKQGDSK